MPNSFAPIIDKETRVLVLGTLPGELSLSMGQYYADPANQFWPIVYALFDEKPDDNYKQRLDFLTRHGMGLWDVVYEAERKGSLDAAIRNEVPNDFRALLSTFPDIKCIAFNGGKAAKLFKKHIKYALPRTIHLLKLHSTSPTPGRHVKSYNEKLAEWKTLLKFLSEGILA